jgi:tetratricopeptide (TPR) repeat protein
VAEQIAQYRRARQGARHWQSIDARFEVEEWQRLAAVPLKDRAEVGRALTLNSEGLALLERGLSREAEKPLRQALLIREKVLGREHPSTARSYNNVASCLHAQGKHAEAFPLYRQALQIQEKVLGREHPLTALSYHNVALCLNDQGKHSEALPLFHKALRICEKVLGKDHPSTATSSNNVALCLWQQERLNESGRLWQQSLLAQEAARVLRAETGFERAQGSSRDISAQSALAVGLATLKQPVNAFRHAEASLARGLLDDLSPLTGRGRTR